MSLIKTLSFTVLQLPPPQEVPVKEEALLNGETLPEIPIDDGPVNLKDDLILLEDSFTPTPVVSTGIETNHVNSDVSADNQVTEQDTDWESNLLSRWRIRPRSVLLIIANLLLILFVMY